MKNVDYTQEENEFVAGGITDEFTARIKILGVGGGGCNAVNRMIEAGIGEGVQLFAVNTDRQALNHSIAEQRLQIGSRVTRGLGAGANPNQGQLAAQEDAEYIRGVIKDTDLLFLTAGMGGGTGTGALPVIASIAKEEGILTMAVVTKPFNFEGERRMKNAETGIENLNKYVDTLVVVPNQKLVDSMPKDAKADECFKKADDILKQSVKGIVDLIINHQVINCDFADIKTVIQQAGMAHIGIGHGEGEDRHIKAVKEAVQSPLLETNIEGSTAVIVSITGKDITMNEMDESCSLIKKCISQDAIFIFGYGSEDESAEDEFTITIIATGFKQNRPTSLFKNEQTSIIEEIDRIPTSNRKPIEVPQETPRFDGDGIESPRVSSPYKMPKFMQRRRK